MRTASYRFQGNPEYVSAYSQINPISPEGLVPQRIDDQYEGVQQLKKPLNWENATERDDFRNIYNPNKGPQPGAYMQAPEPSAAEGEEAKSKIPKYEPRKIKDKAVAEQATEESKDWTYRTTPDTHNYESPLNAVSDYEATNMGNLGGNPLHVSNFNGPTTMRTASYRNQGNPEYVSSYSQIDPAKPAGLVPPPVDQQYDGVPQLKKPLIIENATDKDDFRNVYNPNKLPNLAKKTTKPVAVVAKAPQPKPVVVVQAAPV